MITCEEVRRFLRYNPDTGEFKWRKRRDRSRAWNTAYAGKLAGTVMTVRKAKYLAIRINKKRYLAHRLAWLYVHGEWPQHQIDHINHNSMDNRISNLRDVTNSENHRNMPLSEANTSGHVGVSFCTMTSKWIAIITSDKQINLGRFDTLQEAVDARLRASHNFGYHENHGA